MERGHAVNTDHYGIVQFPSVTDEEVIIAYRDVMELFGFPANYDEIVYIGEEGPYIDVRSPQVDAYIRALVTEREKIFYRIRRKE